MKKCCGLHALRIAVSLMILGLLLAASANAANFTVCHSGCEYSSIQKAIKASSKGDIILVQNGTYFENVKVNKKLTLRGIGNPVVDAGGSGNAIMLLANGIVLEGFTATGGRGDYVSPKGGIKVTSSNNTLIKNNASNNGNEYGYGFGIYLSNSNNNTLTGNTANSNYGDGIHLSSSNKNTLVGNNAFNNRKGSYTTGFGIFLSNSSNNTLTDNNASNNDNGISLSNSGNNTLSHNNASSNIFYFMYFRGNIKGGSGISFSSSGNNTLTGNNMSNNGETSISLDESSDSAFYNQIDITNLVDGKPIFFIKGAKDMVYNSSTNAGTFYCMSCVNVTLKNLDLRNNGNGIFFWNTTNSKIQNVNASGNNLNGIYLSYSSNNTLTGNNASNNGNIYSGSGIYLSSSSNNTLTGNNANSNYGEGLSVHDSSGNTLTGNNASNNGAGTNSNDAGISLSNSSNNTLNGNTANLNVFLGISLYESSNNTVTGNIASNNIESSISTDFYSNNNTIYNNIFNKNSFNFYFYESNNTWNITRKAGINIIGGSFIGGNFWANPDGTGFSQTCLDGNGDGICDQSYTLDENNIDYLPLAKDKIPPKSVTRLKNMSYAKNYINWTWKDPKDVDFKKVMVFIDNKFKKNVSKGKRFYNATNFKSNTRHTISTKTVDKNGNINKTWTNRSAWTAK